MLEEEDGHHTHTETNSCNVIFFKENKLYKCRCEGVGFKAPLAVIFYSMVLKSSEAVILDICVTELTSPIDLRDHLSAFSHLLPCDLAAFFIQAGQKFQAGSVWLGSVEVVSTVLHRSKARLKKVLFVPKREECNV